MRLFAGLCLLLVACNSGSSAPGNASVTVPIGDAPRPRSGTRLKVVWQVSEDGGARVFSSFFHDSKLDVECLFGGGFGGQLRCFPLLDETLLNKPHLFADDHCTQPVLYGSNIHPDGTYYLGIPGCPVQAGAFQPDRSGAPVTAVYRGDGKHCSLVDSAPPDTIYRAVDVSDRFAAARVVPGPAVDGWAPVTIESDDGARAFLGWKNVAEGYTCRFDGMSGQFPRSAEGKIRCFPSTGYVAEPDSPLVHVGDAQCSAPAAEGFATACEEADWVSENRYDQCGHPGPVYHRGGPRLDQVFRGSPGRCMAFDPVEAAFALGPEVPATSFAAVTVASGPGSGRLRPLVLVGLPQPTPVDNLFWDTTLQAPCVAGRICTPFTDFSLDADVYFADPRCQTAIYAASASCSSESGLASRPGDRIGVASLYRVHKRHSGPAFKMDGSDCVAAPAPEGEVFVEAERIDDSLRASVAEVRDP